MYGSDTDHKIDPFQPFTDPATTWNDPSAWQTPFGECGEFGCSDVGWIGANTSDTRVGGGWTSGSGKFGPVSSSRHVVMETASRDAGTGVYVSYGIEGNENLAPDDYTVSLIYEVFTTY
jgi:hypothetical protein